MARVRVILKRTGKGLPGDQPEVTAGVLSINPESRVVKIGESTVSLTATEFDIIYEMASHSGKVYKRAQLASLVLGYDYDSYDRTIDSHIKNLRKKMGEHGKMVETVFGVGYKLQVGD